MTYSFDLLKPAGLEVRRGTIRWVGLDLRLNKFVAFLDKALADAHVTSVCSLAKLIIDGFRGGRAVQLFIWQLR